MKAVGACVAAAALASLAAGAPAQASVGLNYNYQTSYDIYYPGTFDTPPVTNVMLYQATDTGSSLTWAFQINPTSGGDFETITNPFTDPQPTQFASLVGLMVDADSNTHVVLGLATGTAIATAGEDWDQLFPNTSESDLLAALELSTSGGPFCTTGPPCIDSGLDKMFSFMGNDMQNIPDPANAGGVLDGLFAVPGDFTLVSFSNGTTVGGGTSLNTAIPLTPTPEPAGWAMMIVGVAGLGAALRRRGLAFSRG
jgi:hypothetical protein